MCYIICFILPFVYLSSVTVPSCSSMSRIAYIHDVRIKTTRNIMLRDDVKGNIFILKLFSGEFSGIARLMPLYHEWNDSLPVSKQKSEHVNILVHQLSCVAYSLYSSLAKELLRPEFPADNLDSGSVLGKVREVRDVQGTYCRSRDGSVCMATRDELDGPGIKFLGGRGGRDFPHPSRPRPLWPTQPPIRWVPGFYCWVNGPERGADHPPII
jgi:hypothetical protein